MKKRLLVLVAALTLLWGCAGPQAAPTQAPQAEPVRYITPQLVLEALEAGDARYLLLDVRSAEDYGERHLIGSVSAPVTHGENADDPAGLSNLESALTAAAGSAAGDGRPVLLVCYKGGAYALKAQELLMELGFTPDTLLVLEGGMQAWTASGEAYALWLEP